MGNYVNNITEKVNIKETILKSDSKTPSREQSFIKETISLTLTKQKSETVYLKDTVVKGTPSGRPTIDVVSIHDSAIITPTFGARSVCEMWYGGYKFDPAPLISIQRQLIRSGIDEIIMIRTTVNCNGTIITLGNSPSKTFSRLDTEKYIGLKNALAQDHERLVILHESGAFISNVFPRVEGFSTEEGVWVNKIRYTFNFVYDEFVGSNTFNIQSYSDDWNFTQPSDGKIQLTHNISARIDLSPDDLSDKEKEDAVFLAHKFCEDKSGLTNIPKALYSSVYGYIKDYSSLTGAALINEQLIRTNKSESVKVDDGTYTLNETYEQTSSGSTVQVAVSIDESGACSITISGSVTGSGKLKIEKEVDLYTKLNTAVIESYTIAAAEYVKSGASGTLNQKYSSKSTTVNKGANTADYSVTYTDKGYASNIISETLNVSDKKPVAQFAVIPIPGKATGPVIQDMGTLNEGEYTVSGTIVGITIEDALARGSQLLMDNTGSTKGSSSRITNAEVSKDIKGKSITFNYSWAYIGTEATDTLSL